MGIDPCTKRFLVKLLKHFAFPQLWMFYIQSVLTAVIYCFIYDIFYFCFIYDNFMFYFDNVSCFIYDNSLRMDGLLVGKIILLEKTLILITWFSAEENAATMNIYWHSFLLIKFWIPNSLWLRPRSKKEQKRRKTADSFLKNAVNPCLGKRFSLLSSFSSQTVNPLN